VRVPKTEVRTLALPPTARSAKEGRRFVVQVLTDWDCAGLIDAAALLASEVITNAVLHARTPLTVTVERTDMDAVQVKVTDGSPHLPRRGKSTADATTGRGVGLLDDLASSWSVRPTAAGKTVAFTLDPDVDPWAAAADIDWLAADL
jgi:anti-sigma regulatory factor (Ser/Thr protein kinase)